MKAIFCIPFLVAKVALLCTLPCFHSLFRCMIRLDHHFADCTCLGERGYWKFGTSQWLLSSARIFLFLCDGGGRGMDLSSLTHSSSKCVLVPICEGSPKPACNLQTSSIDVGLCNQSGSFVNFYTTVFFLCKAIIWSWEFGLSYQFAVPFAQLRF